MFGSNGNGDLASRRRVESGIEQEAFGLHAAARVDDAVQDIDRRRTDEETQDP